MPDQRSELERKLDALIGPPLYYCADCLRAVKVEPRIGMEPIVTRPCEGACDKGIIAPRKAIATGEGGLNFTDRAKVAYWQVAAALTGRCV
jgi:hypothetical protein